MGSTPSFSKWFTCSIVSCRRPRSRGRASCASGVATSRAARHRSRASQEPPQAQEPTQPRTVGARPAGGDHRRSGIEAHRVPPGARVRRDRRTPRCPEAAPAVEVNPTGEAFEEHGDTGVVRVRRGRERRGAGRVPAASTATGDVRVRRDADVAAMQIATAQLELVVDHLGPGCVRSGGRDRPVAQVAAARPAGARHSDDERPPPRRPGRRGRSRPARRTRRWSRRSGRGRNRRTSRC